mmetsp:Transcript_4729/g.15286  ORF Transcript_4729/g.15286 Transcript_4729/m.15286 type:complete len:262 (-) Transcript_4729:201-986(-)
MLNRSEKKSMEAIAVLEEEFAGGNVSLIKLDLASLDSVRAAAAAVLAKVPSIDALICNAAIAQVTTRELTVDGFESQMGVNYFGHFLLCALLFDRIEESKGRIVVVGSAGYKMVDGLSFDDLTFEKSYASNPVYCESKLAQIMMGFELQRRIAAAGKDTRVYVCHPGASRTNLIANASLAKRAAYCIISLFSQSAERGAYPEVMCATQSGLKDGTMYGPTHRWETVGPVGECELAPHAQDQVAAAKIWKMAEEQTQQVFTV